MRRGNRDSHTPAQWAAIADSTAKKLSSAPPRSLRAVVEMNLPAIELRLKRGWTIAQLVQELDDTGVHTSVAVFKNTLYRLRKKARQQRPRGWKTAASVLPMQISPSHSEISSTPIFKATSETKNHF